MVGWLGRAADGTRFVREEDASRLGGVGFDLGTVRSLLDPESPFFVTDESLLGSILETRAVRPVGITSLDPGVCSLDCRSIFKPLAGLLAVVLAFVDTAFCDGSTVDGM